MTAPIQHPISGGEAHVAVALSITGVRMIVDQGNLDHWMDGSLWGTGSSIRPSRKAFEVAQAAGLVEKAPCSDLYRLTDLGRRHRAIRAARQEQSHEA